MSKTRSSEKRQTKTKRVKTTRISFWKQFKLSRRFLVYFAAAFLAYFLLVILCTVSFGSNITVDGIDKFVVGKIWSFSPNNTASLLNVGYTTYLMALFFINILVVIFLLFAVVYFVMDQKKAQQNLVFKNISWRLIYLVLFFVVSLLMVAFVLVELTSVEKSYQLSSWSSSSHFGGLWKISSSSWNKFKTIRTNTNELIISCLWIWLIVFIASFAILGFTRTRNTTNS